MSARKTAVAQAADALDVLVGRVLRGHFRDARFEQQAHVHEVKREGVLVLYAAQTQRVGQPLGGCDHIRSRAAPYLDDALARKQLDGFPDRAAAHAEHLAQFKFVGHFRARLERRVQNIVINLILDLLGQELIFQVRKLAHLLTHSALM